MAGISLLSFFVLAAGSLPANAASSANTRAHTTRAASQGYPEPLCQSDHSLCPDIYNNPKGDYVGHDEPLVEFKSGLAGSGNNMTYTMTLPKDPKKQPNKSGNGGSTWNFQLRPAFWFGMT